MAIEDHSKFQLLKDAEIEDPAPQKPLEDRTIYLSRGLQLETGPLILCDFGEARIGNKHQGSAMPTPYRAPEIILDMTWGYSVDVWAAGLVVRTPFIQTLFRTLLITKMLRHGVSLNPRACSDGIIFTILILMMLIIWPT